LNCAFGRGFEKVETFFFAGKPISTAFAFDKQTAKRFLAALTDE